MVTFLDLLPKFKTQIVYFINDLRIWFRLLDVWDSYGFVYLRIQNMQTGQVYKISSILKDDTEYCLWEIASLDYLMNLSNKRGGT